MQNFELNDMTAAEPKVYSCKLLLKFISMLQVLETYILETYRSEKAYVYKEVQMQSFRGTVLVEQRKTTSFPGYPGNEVAKKTTENPQVKNI